MILIPNKSIMHDRAATKDNRAPSKSEDSNGPSVSAHQAHCAFLQR